MYRDERVCGCVVGRCVYENLCVSYDRICEFCNVMSKGSTIKYNFGNFLAENFIFTRLKESLGGYEHSNIEFGDLILEADILDVYIEKINNKLLKIVRMRVEYNFQEVLNPNKNLTYTYFKNECQSWEQHGKYCTLTFVPSVHLVTEIQQSILHISNKQLQIFQNKHYILYTNQNTTKLLLH